MPALPIHWLVSAAQPRIFEPPNAAQNGLNRLHNYIRNISTGSFSYTSEVDTTQYRKIVFTHAVLACLAWGLFAPLGAILLRSGMRGVDLLRLHAFWQLFVYAMYITAAGLGIWMRLQLSSDGAVWRYPHAAIGLVMLIGVFFQPWLGYIHHRIFKSRLDAISAGDTSKSLGRTIVTQVHLWLGRLLIAVGVINGGLGIMVTWERGEHLQSMDTSKRAVIAYAIVAGSFFLLYAACMVQHERRRAPLVLNMAERSSDSSTASNTSIQSVEIGRRFSVFSEDLAGLTEKERSRSRGRRGSSTEKMKLIPGQLVKAHGTNVSPIEEVRTP